MTTFLEWLKQNQETPECAREIKSYLVRGTFYNSVRIKDEPITVSKEESAMLIKMEDYVNEFLEVSDSMFNEMLKNKKLKKYEQLVNEYVPISNGIASDLRGDGWKNVAQYIAATRNINSRMEKAMSRQLPEIKTTEEFNNTQIEENFESEL